MLGGRRRGRRWLVGRRRDVVGEEAMGVKEREDVLGYGDTGQRW